MRYWKDPAATRAALEDGWLHTGDLVSRDAEGYYWFRGRTKEIIIRAGREGASAEAEELREFGRKSLADYKTPEKFVFLQALPKGLTGKVQRRALKEMLTATAAGA